jgi:YycE-like protein
MTISPPLIHLRPLSTDQRLDFRPLACYKVVWSSPGALAPSMVSWHADAAASLTPQAPGRRRGGEKGLWNSYPRCARMLAAGFQRVPSYNPYWEAQGQTFEDLDGYRVVLQNIAWTS